MQKVIDSNYSSIEELVAGYDTYSIAEIHALLNHIITAWRQNELKPAALYALLKFVYVYLDRLKIRSSIKNKPPIPICYFSSYLLSSASLIHSYLKTLSFDVTLFPLHETDRHLRAFVEKKRPPVVLFTISEFLHVQLLRQLIPYLRGRDLKLFIGGIPFLYDESLKRPFSDCIFPRDLTEMTLLLENSLAH